MILSVRKTIEEDLEAIQQIRTDPRVAKSQFRMAAGDDVEYWTWLLFGEGVATNKHLRYSTVLLDDQVVGHISQIRASYEEEQTSYLGWNLAPDHWGNGLMHAALGQFMTDLFADDTPADERADVVVADCFSRNTRCIRLMSKLNFQPLPIGLLGRLQIFLAQNCWHWIHRFCLTSTDLADVYPRNGAVE